jgi:hypothetical protein
MGEGRIDKGRRQPVERRGFVMPVVIFGLVLMSAAAVAALLMAGDEHRSSRAMREASSAFYAAEAGLHEVYAHWDSLVGPGLADLGPADSLMLDWRELDGGARYRAVVYRWDVGDQPVYSLEVEGRGPGELSGQRKLSFALTATPGPGMGYKIGECCEAPVVLKGTFRQSVPNEDGSLFHSGYDTYPPGWYDAGVCADTLIDKPGIIMQDTSGMVLDPEDAVLEGVPPIVEDPQLNDSLFDFFGDHTWQDIKDRADIIIDTTGWVYMADGSNPVKIDGSLPDKGLEGDEVYPRYTVDLMTGEVLCDTNHPLNWGSDDPNDPCFNHFPVILSRGEVDLRGGPLYGGPRFYGQGVIILDFDDVARRGSEFEMEHDASFRGVVLGKGCMEVQYGAQFYGAMFLDATYDGVTCDKSHDFFEECDTDDGECAQTTRLQWSQCAVDRALVNSSLVDLTEVTIPDFGEARRLGSRSFSEMLR